MHYTVEELIAERFAAAAVEFGVSEKEAQRGATPEGRHTGAAVSHLAGPENRRSGLRQRRVPVPGL